MLHFSSGLAFPGCDTAGRATESIAPQYGSVGAALFGEIDAARISRISISGGRAVGAIGKSSILSQPFGRERVLLQFFAGDIWDEWF
jgi:hypothetical protein